MCFRVIGKGHCILTMRLRSFGKGYCTFTMRFRAFGHGHCSHCKALPRSSQISFHLQWITVCVVVRIIRLLFGIPAPIVQLVSHLSLVIGSNERRQQTTKVCCLLSRKSGWLDSNQRPHAPQTRTLTGLSYIPNCGRKSMHYFVKNQAFTQLF